MARLAACHLCTSNMTPAITAKMRHETAAQALKTAGGLARRLPSANSLMSFRPKMHVNKSEFFQLKACMDLVGSLPPARSVSSRYSQNEVGNSRARARGLQTALEHALRDTLKSKLQVWI
jgi:hypothetical protein